MFPVQNGDSHRREMFLAPSDKQIHNHDTMVKSPSLPIITKVKGIKPWQDKMVSHTHTNLLVNATVRLPHLQSRDITWFYF